MKLISALIVTLAASCVLAQGHASVEHENSLAVLSPLVGTWVGKTTFNGGNGKSIEADTTCKFTSIARGHYIRQDQVTIIPERGPTDITNMIGYDRRMGFFNSWWFFDNAGNEPARVQGRLEGKKLVMTSVESATSKAPVLRWTLNFEVANVLDDTLEMKMNGEWRKLFTIHYTKKQS